MGLIRLGTQERHGGFNRVYTDKTQMVRGLRFSAIGSGRETGFFLEDFVTA
ncbi:hypothetical protein [Tychonema sp. LEGE 07203]|uniref:hypothetical protein n=1 Tax=Tychonema sp. LEGE 07203 TaxID=1828671 RepID=UPI0018810801|nr:hypothetical protein [Tychonema sp. LEGE 07203]MBE9095797.1 hypothetical protein [Tychonema sp. LEGE 07203]